MMNQSLNSNTRVTSGPSSLLSALFPSLEKPIPQKISTPKDKSNSYLSPFERLVLEYSGYKNNPKKDISKMGTLKLFHLLIIL